MRHPVINVVYVDPVTKEQMQGIQGEFSAKPSPSHQERSVDENAVRYDGGLGVILEPRLPMLPFLNGTDCPTIWHSYLRQTLGIHYLILLDHIVLKKEKGS